MLKPLLLLPALLSLAFMPQQPAQTPPAGSETAADAAKMVNPVKPTPASQAAAKKMYGYDCAMCHGESGNGKGEVAMKTAMKDFTDPAALKDLTDGEIYSIIKNGKGEMSGEGDRLKPDGLWNMVILVRSFAKKS